MTLDGASHDRRPGDRDRVLDGYIAKPITPETFVTEVEQ